jgi:hypothetical protein
MTKEEALQILENKKLSFRHRGNVFELFKNDTYTTIVYQFSMSIERTPFCCGVCEIGVFDTYGYDSEVGKDCKEALKALIADDVAKTFNSYIKGKKHCLLMFNLNGNPGCKFWESIVNEYFPEKFSEAKTFVNLNTGRTIKTFLQNI